MKKTKKSGQKSLTNQFHGGRDDTLGNIYETNYFVQKIVEMIVSNQTDGDSLIKIKREKRDAHVDDVFVQTRKGRKYYYQCKRFLPSDRKDLYSDFVNGYLTENPCELWLVTQGSAKELRELTLLAQSGSYSEFNYQLNNDIRYKKENAAFKSIQNCFPQSDSDLELRSYDFLKTFHILFYDEIWSREQIIDKLNTIYEKDSSGRIRDRLYLKATSVEWVDKEISWDEVKSEIDVLKPQLNYYPSAIDNSGKSIDPSSNKPNSISIFTEFSVTFENKLDYLFEIINNHIDSDEVQKALCLINEDDTLVWHFLKNLKASTWFPKIKDNIIKTISEDTSDSAVKYQLLNFFDKCADTYSDEILPLLLSLEKNTQSYNILSNLVKNVRILKPKSVEAVDALWQILDDLVEHQHPWVRREIPETLLSFTEIDEDKVFDMFGRLLTYSPPPLDVTAGTPTLALTFQGRDNENWVFEETIKTLSKLLANPKYAEKAHALARKMEINALSKDERSLKSEQGIILDDSSFWLSDTSFDSSMLEYNCDHKERIALEIEKSLNELALNNDDLALNLLNKLLLEKYEVFHLIVIKVLIRHIESFLKLSRSLVFDLNVWRVYNIRKYFLQTLANTYFSNADNKEITEFAKMINQKSFNNDKETLYLYQDMLISIPEEFRNQQTKDNLIQVSDILKNDPKITKSFEISTLSGIRPDITVDELNTKSEDELVQIMLDSSNGKRAASHNIAPVFSQLIDHKPDLLPGLLARMKGKEIASGFAGEMTKAYINKNRGNVVAIVNLNTFLSENDTWARIEITNFFKEMCRNREIQNYTQDFKVKIRDTLITLTQDKNPESDDTHRSSNPQPDDAITRGINSVRGIATEALIAFYYYFPSDGIACDRLRELADDKTKAIKSTLIYSLSVLVNKNFALCERIVNKFRNQRDPELDFALIHFFSKLDCDKFLGYQDFIRLIFNNTNEQINENLGELIGYRFLAGCSVQTFLEEIINNRKGTKHTKRSLAFVFESQLGKFIGQSCDTSIANYLKRLLSPQNDFEVVERASFVFQRDEIKPEFFGFLDENGLTTELILNKLNIPAQAHLVHYLKKCIDKNISIERCVELIHEQVMTIETILSDQLIEKQIAEIVATLLESSLSAKTHVLLQDIFNAGLERGWEEFYAIYYDLKNNKYHIKQ